ncbi:glycosyltransferase family 4 protein [Yersinia intermedia]|uniref:glycosyltransferase family 4 protein n=1 Tax=Yersinia intermedia TaxID=631 RepID=UPI0015F2C2B2|nr:glycosyltransferase family 4 protein [Yersinia intermedia]
MKILHICLYSYFTENMNYQENFLTTQNALDGHDVCIVTDGKYYFEGSIEQKEPEDKIISTGVRLIRVPILKLFPSFLTDKLRIAPSLYSVIYDFSPDIIFYHGVVGVGLLAVNKYKKKYPATNIYLDSHEDANNSGRTFISKWVQYKFITRFMLSFLRKKICKIFYVSYECREFLREMYNIKDSEMEFFPLGGLIKDREEKKLIRNRIRKCLNLNQNDVLFIHSGKLDKEKKTKEILNSFYKVNNENLKLLIAGNIPESNSELLHLIKRDNRVIYLGWLDGNELVDYICSSDCYIQPGTQSATLQIAMCCGLPVIIYPYPSHKPYLDGNGFYVRGEEDILQKFQIIAQDSSILLSMENQSYKIAKELLDYEVLSSRYCK